MCRKAAASSFCSLKLVLFCCCSEDRFVGEDVGDCGLGELLLVFDFSSVWLFKTICQ